MTERRRHILIWVGALAAILLGFSLYSAPSFYEVVGEGEGQTYTVERQTAYEIRFFDTFNVMLDGEARPDLDQITSAALVAVAGIAVFMHLMIGAAGGDRRMRRFYGLASLGFLFLALDEMFGGHESIADNATFFGSIPGVERPDDAIFAIYGFVAIAFIYYYREYMLRLKTPRLLYAGGLMCFAGAAAADLVASSLDEPLEIASGGFIVAGFITMLSAHMTDMLAPPPEHNAPLDSGPAGRA